MRHIEEAIKKLEWRIKTLCEDLSNDILLGQKDRYEERIKDINICIDVLKKLKEVPNEPE